MAQIIDYPRSRLVSEEVEQVAHGLAVTSCVYMHPTTKLWTIADSSKVLELADAQVIEVVDADNFILGYMGRVINIGHGFADGKYYVDTTGLPTATKPVAGWAQTCMIVTDPNTYLMPGFIAETI